MADSSYPGDLLYHPEHDWARIESDGDSAHGSDPAGAGGSDLIATLGITWYAQDSLGEVVFFDPPPVGTTLNQGDAYAEVESVKAVSDVIAPLSGEIVEVNEALADAPDAINDDPYGEGWLVKVRLSDPAERDALMDAGAYTASLG
jgi:glycine cleavage system H protein